MDQGSVVVVKDTYAYLREGLAHHVITRHTVIDEDHSISLIQRPDCSEYWAEIVCASASSLIVHGDYDMCGFRGWGNKGGWRGTLEWVASSSLDYLQTKAAALTSSGYVRDFCRDQAKADLKDYVEQEYMTEEVKDEALSLLDSHGDPYKAREYVYDETNDAELCGFGETVSDRVVFAHVAAQKLLELLKERENE